jgi:glycosyltransferase involved in cell wall biosynthesis
MRPDISVVIPTFRRPKELVSAMKSALQQTDFALEVLVIDDSPEGAAQDAVASLADARVTYVKRPVPSGGSPALVRNDAWPHAQGQYLHFLDDDDQVAPGAYRALADALERNPRKGMAFGRIQPVGKDIEMLRHEERFFEDAAFRAKIGEALDSKFWMLANMLFKNTLLACSATLFRRSCVEALGGYDPKLGLYEDLDIHIRATRRFGCAFVDRVVMYYQTGAPSLVHGVPINDRVVSAYRAIYEKYEKEHGSLELLAIKVFARTALRLFPGVDPPTSSSGGTASTD